MGVHAHLKQQLLGLDNEQACWRLKVQGLTNREIAAELGIAPSSVSRAINRALKKATEDLKDAVNDHRAVMRARLEVLYKAAMDAYYASMTERRRTRSKVRTVGEGTAEKPAPQVKETQIDTEARVGDPRFLAEAYKAIDGIRKLMGLDAPTRMQVVDPDRPHLTLTDAEIQAELRAALREAGIDADTLTADGPAAGERTH